MPELLPPTVVRPAPVELLRVADATSGLRSLRDGARYHRVRAGVYAPRATWVVLPPWERYLARVHAYALINPGAIFAYESAAALLGLPLFGEPRDIHVFDFGRTRSRRFGDVWVHTSVDEREIEVHSGLSMTSRTHTAIDLMRVLPAPFGLAVGDAVVSPAQGRAVTRAQLETAAAGQANGRGRRLLAVVLGTVDPRSESPVRASAGPSSSGRATSRPSCSWSSDTRGTSIESTTGGEACERWRNPTATRSIGPTLPKKRSVALWTRSGAKTASADSAERSVDGTWPRRSRSIPS